MSRPVLRLLGGMGIGCLMTVPYFVWSHGAAESLSLLNGISGMLSSHEILQGLMLSLIIFILAGLGMWSTQDVQRAPIRLSLVESYRQRRGLRLRRTGLRRFD